MTKKKTGYSNGHKSITRSEKMFSKSRSNLTPRSSINPSKGKDVDQVVGNDLRDFLRVLAEKNEIITITKKVKKKFEIAAIVSCHSKDN